MVVRECVGCDDVVDHDTAMRALVARIHAHRPAGERAILIAHAFVAGGAECESERPLSVGGAGTVDASSLDGFDYVALGHLHCPQRIGKGEVRYSGSLLKYSFDEAHQPKGVYLVEMDARGACKVDTIRLTPRRDVRRIEGEMADLLKGPIDGRSPDDYLEVTLTDDGPVLDAIGRLREVYPNVMSIRRPERVGAGQAGDRPDIRGKTALQLFGAFYQHVAAAELSPEQEAAFAAVVEETDRRTREVATP
jgi:exonuclease SbcD